MFERRIEETIALFVDRTIAEGSDILLKDILASSLPQSVKRFYELEAELWVADEKLRLLSSPHFHYNDDRILAHFDTIVDLSKDYAIFQREGYLRTLDKAVKLLFNYVCRPQWTLVKYIFSDVDNASAETILHAMSYFTDYAYYSVVMREYFERKHIVRMHRDRFEDMLGLIDNEIIRSSDVHTLSLRTEPIFALFNIDGDAEYARVPIEALSIFFDDKGASAIVEKLDSEKVRMAHLSLSELETLLAEVDYLIGADISELVNRHVTGIRIGDRPSQEIIQDIAGYEDATTIGEAWYPADEIPPPRSFEEEPASTDELPGIFLTPDELYQDDSDEGGVPLEASEFIFDHTTPVVPRDMDIEEITALSGEQITPEFYAEPALIEKEDELFISTLPDLEDDSLTASSAGVGQPPLAAGVEAVGSTMASPIVPSGSDDDLLRELGLTDEDFIEQDEEPVPASAPVDLDIPDFELPDDVSVAKPVPPAQEPEIPPLVSTDATGIFTTTSSAEEVISQYGDIRALINSADRKKFIKKVFERNEESYEQSIDRLNGKATWREASEIIDEIFLQHNVDMYSRIAVKFTDDIYRRFSQKKP